MICSKCSNPGVLNNANGKEFYYCRVCRDEIPLEEVKPTCIDSELESLRESIHRLSDISFSDAELEYLRDQGVL